MLVNTNFLCEIGTEEIPAGYISPIVKACKEIFSNKLKEERIGFSDVEVLATPRRIAIFISGLAEKQSSEEIEIKGPPVKAAYDAAKNPTKALTGFLKANNAADMDIILKETDRGEYIFIKKKMESRGTDEIIPSIIEHLVKSIPSPKSMKWSDKDLSFPRTIIYFLIIFNGKVVPLNISGIAAGNLTRGHYIQSGKMIEIKNIDEYENKLKENKVILNHISRREMINNLLVDTAKKINGVLVQDEDLLDTVTFLVEDPHIAVCEFEKSFLEIPEIVLITEMKEHQKYFAVKDKSGKLMSNFLVVSNNPVTGFVKDGNERVIRARFSDAAFFFSEDRKFRLSDRVEELKSVLFHKELGSIYDKIQRMSRIADYISEKLKLGGDVRKKIGRAILLCKTDLQTKMVFEFTSLQGKIGTIYALLDGEDSEVANAISEHYTPRFQGDKLPVNIVSVAVSVSEKLDNIFGTFSVGNIPKGSEDPYALRRQANAILEILISNGLNLELGDILNNISGQYKNGKELAPKILDFFSARAKTIFQEKGFRYDEIDACLSIAYYDYLELLRRAKSLSDFRKSDDFSGMLICFKRMNSILSIFRQKNPGYKFQFSEKLLKEQAEKDLYGFFESKLKKIEDLIEKNRYTELFQLLIEGKAAVDSFFEKVMVMVDDAAIRDNRLALLEKILLPFKNLLDFSKISE
ncbi:MAG: glycine--tRNA ligase subunit beta [Spirochaetes bacterium]|jgi:glycyl-tRNA synthetase beta chain|nr:glycine--tRNA ligase subunit beta [Spirochaetota bacterium]